MSEGDYSKLTMAELLEEMEAWDAVINAPKGPGSPSNAVREAAQRLLDEAEAWYARREIESERASW